MLLVLFLSRHLLLVIVPGLMLGWSTKMTKNAVRIPVHSGRQTFKQTIVIECEKNRAKVMWAAVEHRDLPALSPW